MTAITLTFYVYSMIIAYMREQLCLLQREGPYDQEGTSRFMPTNEIAGAVPRVGLIAIL